MYQSCFDIVCVLPVYPALISISTPAFIIGMEAWEWGYNNWYTKQYFLLIQLQPVSQQLEESPVLAIDCIAGSDLGMGFGVHLCCHGNNLTDSSTLEAYTYYRENKSCG